MNKPMGMNQRTEKNEGSVARREGRQAEPTHQRPMFTPPVDVYENQDEVLLVADLPGVSREAVSIHFDKDELTVSAQRGQDDDAVEYRRIFVVSPGIDPARIQAELSQGVLRVHLPKSEAVRPRQIEVRAG